MRPGDRVVYLRERPINLDRDLGTITGIDDDGVRIAFDDGDTAWCDYEDLATVVGFRSQP